MNFYAFSGLLNGIAATVLGLFIYLRASGDSRRYTYGFYCLSLSVWSYFYFAWQLTHSHDLALLFVRALMAGAILIPAFFFHHTLTILNLEGNHRFLLRACYVASAVFFVSNFTPLFIAEVQPAMFFEYWPKPGIVFHFYLAWFLACILYTLYLIATSYLKATGILRNQYFFLFVSCLIGYGGGATNFPLWYGIQIPPNGTILVSVYTVILAYIIIRYRLIDTSVVMHKGLTYAFILSGALVPAYLAYTIIERATIYSLPPLLAGLLVLSSGLWILLKNPSSETNRVFGLLCLGVCTWLFSFFMIYSANDGHKSLFWGKFLYIGVVYIPAFFYHFSQSFLKLPTRNAIIWINYSISSAFLMLVPTNYLVEGQYTYYWGNYPKAGIVHPFLMGYFCAIGSVTLYRLYVGQKTQATLSPLEGIRAKFVFWASLIGYAAAVDFAQSYGLEMYPPGFLFISLWVVLFAYAIAKHQLLDMSVFISKKKTVSYAEGFAITASFYVVTLLLIQTFTGSTEYILAALLLAASLICAELLVNLQKRMEHIVGKALFRKKYDAYETLTAFSKDMVTILDLKNLYDRFLGTLSWVLNVPAVSLFVLDNEKQIYTLASSKGPESDEVKDLRVPSHHALPRHLVKTKAALVREELEYGSSQGANDPKLETLKLMRSEVCLPLVNQDRLVGFCNLGHRDDQQTYTEEDLSLLTTLTQNAAVAVDNALLYEDLKRSQLLMRRTDRLRSLETIAGGFAHEIRNPLTSIKTFIQLAPERTNDPDFISGFSKVVNDDVHRIERLIEEILDYARYMKPRLTEEDLNDIVLSCLYFVKIKADSLAVTIDRDLATDLPSVMLDRQHLKQVLLNLLLNAMDAMRPTGGRLTIRTHRLIKPGGEEWVQVEVADTGPGIEPANIEHIFDPFYTTKHESGEREGTGLGLAIVHQIVQEHSGTIEVDSAIGKGTTFFINLPVSPSEVGISSLRE